MTRILLLILFVSSLSLSQWRDSSTFIIPSPAGKAVRIWQMAIGDTNTRKTSGAIAYLNGTFYTANGSYYSVSGGVLDSLTYVTKNTTQVVTSPKYWTARQYMTSLSVDTIVTGSSGMVYLLNNFTLGGNEFFDAILTTNVTYEGNSIDTAYTNAVSNVVSTDSYLDIATAGKTKYLTLDTAGLRSKFDSLYNRVDLTDIVTAPDYHTARQYFSSAAVDTIDTRTLTDLKFTTPINVEENIDVFGSISGGGGGQFALFDSGYVTSTDGHGWVMDNASYPGNSESFNTGTFRIYRGSNSRIALAIDSAVNKISTRTIAPITTSTYDLGRYNFIWDSLYVDDATITNNLLVSAGYVDSDSIRDDATTRATSGTWHSGLGAWSLGTLSIGTTTIYGNFLPSSTAGSRNIGALTQGFQTVAIEHDANKASGLLLNQTLAGIPSPRIMFGNSTSWAGRGNSIYLVDANTLAFTTNSTINSATGNIRWKYDSSRVVPETNDAMDFGTSSTGWRDGYFSGKFIIQDSLRIGQGTPLIIKNDGTITTTGAGSFGALSGTTGTFSGSGVFGGSSSATTRLTVRNGLLANATEWYNSRGIRIAKVDSNGAGTFGSSGSAFTAVVDSTALEFTANSVEYRALQNAYGELYLSADPDTITIGTAGVYYTTKDLDAGVSKYVTLGDSSMTIKIAGYYHITVSSSMTHSTNNTIVHFSLFKNDVEEIKMEAERKIVTGGDFGNASASCVIYLAANDIMKIKYSADNTGTAIINHFNFTAHRTD